MIAVVQRVTQASVTVGGELVGEIGRGLVALVAVIKSDTETDVKWMARKLMELRVFRSPDGEKHFDLDVRAVGGSILLVSNFTVAGATRQGRRPSPTPLPMPTRVAQYYNSLVQTSQSGVPVETGRFRADMAVHLVNDGPVTLILNSLEGRSPGPTTEND